jgi:hypothetical protein
MKPPTLRDAIEKGVIYTANRSDTVNAIEREVRHWLAGIFQTEYQAEDRAQAKRLWGKIEAGDVRGIGEELEK